MRLIWLILLLVACSDGAERASQPDTSTTRNLLLPDADLDLGTGVDLDVSDFSWIRIDLDAKLDADLDAEVGVGCDFGVRRECSLAPVLMGECSRGTQTCSRQGWSQCTPTTGRRIEVCDGLDNDCDGTADENELNPGNPLTQACYTGQRPDTKFGVCSPGVYHCQQQEDGSYGFGGECVGQVLPGPEVCDGLDNDCNGITDDLEGKGDRCVTAEPALEVGECHPGKLACVAGSPDLSCIDEGVPQQELCDELDNDCDGSVDEGLGRCDCANPLFVPRPEICNGVDDDCDGIIDNEGNGLNVRLSTMCYTNEEGELVPVENPEDFPPMFPPCVGGRALCEQNNEGDSGYFQCVGEVRPGRERCNGLDDDCDGNADEGFENGTAAVVFGIDISGSMEDHEIETAVEVADLALRRLANSHNICYIVAIIGRANEPILVPPSLGCVPADGNGGVNAREALRAVADGQWMNQGRHEGSWDLIYDTAIDDRDIDGDGVPENVLWRHDPADLQNGVDINLGAVDTRVVIIIGDEHGQTNRGLDQETVAEQVHASNTIVYVITPYASIRAAVRTVQPSYSQLFPQANGSCVISPNREYCDYFYPIVRDRNRAARIAEIEAAMEEVMADLDCYEEEP